MDPSEHRQNNEIHPRYLLRLHCIDGLDNNTWLVKLVLTQCDQIISGAALTFLRLKRKSIFISYSYLTNDKNLNKGIKAPELKGKIIFEKKIDEDELMVIKPF